jgi:type IV secretory pathway component VirB8
VAANAGGPQTVKYPGFVYSTDLIKQAVETEKWVETKFRRERAARIGWKFFAVTGWLVAVLLVLALDYTIPLERLIPVFFYQRPDGVVETALTTDSLPADLSDANIQAWLWQYVSNRESYSYAEYLQHGRVVGVMSSDAVRAAYDAWADGANKDSYVATYAQRGVVRVAMREVTHFEPATASRPGEYTVHFERTVEMEGEPRHQTDVWSVSLKFIQNYNRGFRINDIRTFNPSRIVVIAYPGPQSLTPTPSQTHGGGH